MLRPFIDGKHLERNRHRQRLLEDLGHFRVAGRSGVQGPVARAVLKNDEWEQRALGDVVVAPLPHRDSIVEIVTAKKRLPQLPDISFALELNSKLFPNGAGAPVASDQVRRANRFLCAVIWLDDGSHGVCVLRE